MIPFAGRSQLVLSGEVDVKGQYLSVNPGVYDTTFHPFLQALTYADLNLSYKNPEQTFSSYIDLSVSGAYRNILSAANGSYGLFLYQGWVQYRPVDWFALQAGRVELDYTDEIFTEARQWDNLVSSHNAIIVHFVTSDTTYMADVAFCVNNFLHPGSPVNTSTSVNNYRYMTYLYQHVGFLSGNTGATAFVLADFLSPNQVPGSDLYGRVTMGGNLWFDLDTWNLFGTGYYQTGHATEGRRLSAYYFSSYVSYQACKPLNLMLAFEHMSGNNFADTLRLQKVLHVFSMLYGGSYNRFNSPNEFSTMVRSNLNPGLNNLYLEGTSYLFDSVLEIQASYHWYSLPYTTIRQVNTPAGESPYLKVSRQLAQELDLEVTYTPLSSLEIDVGYSHIFSNGTLQRLNGWKVGSRNQFSYAYVEVNYTPEILRRPKNSH